MIPSPTRILAVEVVGALVEGLEPGGGAAGGDRGTSSEVVAIGVLGGE
jgi:hypothetical protein